jgi:CBS domain-containing protein
MSDEPVTADPDWPVVRAVRAMTDHGVNRLPVVDKAGRPLGVLTRDDVLRAVAACHQREAGDGAVMAEHDHDSVAQLRAA